MKLENLYPLYRDMKGKQVERVRFPFSRNGRTFDVFFFIDEAPFILLFGLRGGTFSFEVPVKKGFEVDHILSPDDYHGLCEALGLKFDQNDKFKTSFFFDDFNKIIPPSCSGTEPAQSHEVATYRSDVEEADKKYFYGWRDNNKYGTAVTPENLEKTKKLLGVKAYKRCEEKNISSRWTDNPEDVEPFELPS